MKRYYMELKDNKPIIHVVEESDRHKIWRDYPDAKEISKSMYLDLVNAIQTHNQRITTCQMCGSKTEELVVKEQMIGLKDEFIYLNCTGCGHSQIKSVPNLSGYYPNNYYSFKKPKKTFFSSASYKAFRKLNVNKNANILDYGCGSGAFVEELHRHGYSYSWGYDPYLPSEIIQDSKSTGVSWLSNNINRLPMEYWDVITLNHVFEHLSDPLCQLQALKQLLKPEGKIIIRTPYRDSYAFKKYRENWVQYDAPRHINVFTRKSLQIALDTAGFNIMMQYDDSYHFQFTGSELYLKNKSLQENSLIKRLTSPKSYWYYIKAKLLNRKSFGDQGVTFAEKK